MNIRDLDSIIKRYRELENSDQVSFFNEKVLLENFKNHLEWQDYSEVQKHKYHKIIFNVINKTQNQLPFKHQVLVIEIYELLIRIFNLFETKKKNETIFRLLSIIEICRYYKGEFRDLKKINIEPFVVLKNHIEQNIDDLEEFSDVFLELKQKIGLLEKMN